MMWVISVVIIIAHHNIRAIHFKRIMRKNFSDYYREGYTLIIGGCFTNSRIQNRELRRIHRRYYYENLLILWVAILLTIALLYFR